MNVKLAKVLGCVLILSLMGNVVNAFAQTKTPETPIVSTRGHFEDTNKVFPWFISTIRLAKGHTVKSFDTKGDIPGLERGECPEEIVIYVHGFQNSKDDAIENFNRANKSLKSNGYKFPVIGFSWDSDQGELDWSDAQKVATMNGEKLAEFIKVFECKCPNTKVRIVSHSLGARVVLEALDTLKLYNDFRACFCTTFKIQSVALLGAAVDNEEVQISDYGEAIEKVVVGDVWNYWNSEDDILSGLYGAANITSGGISIDQALGEDGSEKGIKKPKNFHDEDVTKEVGDDHSGYNGPTKDPDVTVDKKGENGDGVMDKVKLNWDNESKKLTPKGLDVHAFILADQSELCPKDTFARFDDNDNQVIGDVEILEIVKVWIDGEIDDDTMRTAIKLWIEQEIIKTFLMPSATFGTFPSTDPRTPFFVNETIGFDGSFSVGLDGGIVDYAWDFGDGTTGVGQTLEHVYVTPGDLAITLTVTDSNGLTDSISLSVNVRNEVIVERRPPTADFVFSPNDPSPGDEIVFDASQSFDPDGNVVDYIWDFGDGNSGRGLSTTHVFEREGVFTVVLTVVDDDGLSDGARVSLSVQNNVPPSPPVITFIEAPSTVVGNTQPVPLKVFFTDSNGDLSQIRFRTVQGPNASNPPQTSDLGSFQGQTSGTINLSIFCQNVGDTPRPFPVTDEIVLIDALGLESAPVTYSYTCLPA